MSRLFAATIGCFLTTLLLQIDAKVFTPCELAQELRRQQIPESQIATWVCIAHYESRLNSSAVSGTGDHGIFQISEEFWCSPPGRGKACALTCAELEDDDISDDIDCIQTIFDEHQGLSGNGFNAWAVYPRCKKASAANRFIRKCTTSGSIDNSIDSADTPFDVRNGRPSYSSRPVYSTAAPKSSSFSKPSYSFIQDYSKPSFGAIQDYSKPSFSAIQDYSKPSFGAIQDYSRPSFSAIQDSSRPSFSAIRDFSKPSFSAIQDYSKPSFSAVQDYSKRKDYSFKAPYTPSQNFDFTRTSVSPLKGYDYFRGSSPSSSTTSKPFQIFSSSTAPPRQPPLVIPSYSPSLFSPARPASYSVGFIYPKPLETKSTTPAPVFRFSTKTSIASNSGNRGTIFGFRSTTPAPQVYKSYTRSGDSVVKTSSPAPPYRIKAPWEDFPWWNGGK